MMIHTAERMIGAKEWPGPKNDWDKYRQVEDEKNMRMRWKRKRKGGGGVGDFPDIKAGREELLPDDNVHMWRHSFLETDRHLILLGMELIDLSVGTCWPETSYYYIIFQDRYI